jgi:stage II sporulation protein M
MKKWFKITAYLFIFSAVVGAVAFFINPDLLVKIVQQYQDKFGPSPALDFNLVKGIFTQNVTVSAFALFGGFFFGLASLLVVFVNGFLIGFIITAVFVALKNHQQAFDLILRGIVPHGIFEIPAFFFAASLGFKLGLEWLGKDSKGQRLKVLGNNLRDSLLYFLLIATVLFAAAIIEVFVSGRIIR